VEKVIKFIWWDKDITLDSNIKEDLTFTDLDYLHLVMSLEEEFDIEIQADDIEFATTKTVKDIAEYIRKRLEDKQ
jgi:acyl carrier protein